MSYRGRSKGSYGNNQTRSSKSFNNKSKKSNERRLVSFYSGWKKNLQEFRKDVRQGSIPDKVWNNESLQAYITEREGAGVFGYVGSFGRSIASDKILMEEMAKAKIRSDRVAQFIMSSDGRHIADRLPDKEAFRKALNQYLNHYH